MRISRDSILENIRSILIILTAALVIKSTIVEAYQIPTGSMENTILIGDFILGNKFIYGIHIPFTDYKIPGFKKPKPGDIVIFKFPKDKSINYIKRCVAVEGQTVEIRNKVLYVDGKKFDDPGYLKFTDPYTIPP
ncbi:MAG: signal peptidase I, partial [Fidelibacterota bacterium]